MSTLKEQREELQKKLADVDKAINDATQTLQTQQAEKTRLTAGIATLTQLEGSVETTEKPIDAQRAGAIADSQAAEDWLKKIRDATKDPEVIEAKVQEILNTVNTPIADLEQKINELKQKQTQTETSITEANDRVKALQAKVTDLPKKLQQLVTDMTAARTQLAQLRVKLQAELAAGRTISAFYYAWQIQELIKELRRLADEKLETELTTELQELPKKLQDEQKALADLKAYAETIKAKLATDEGALQSLKTNRDAEIQGRLIASAAAGAMTPKEYPEKADPGKEDPAKGGPGNGDPGKNDCDSRPPAEDPYGQKPPGENPYTAS